MKKSLRAKRMEKHHRRHKSSAKLQLVSLMDIFTILVFFLLLNSSDVEILQTDKTIALPESISTQRPDETLVIRINTEALFVGPKQVATMQQITQNSSDVLEALRIELINYAAGKEKTKIEEERGRAVTIMGDQTVPYAVLKRIMTTCAAADYRDMALAVSQVYTNSLNQELAPSASGATIVPSVTGEQTP